MFVLNFFREEDIINNAKCKIILHFAFYIVIG